MSRYAYTPGQPEKLSLSAAGLLTRQYLGWQKDEPDLLAGCEYLMAATCRPSPAVNWDRSTTTTTPPRCCITWKAPTSTCGTTACAST